MSFRNRVDGGPAATGHIFVFHSSNSHIHVFCTFVDKQVVWLMGSSILKWAQTEALIRPGGCSLNLDRENISLWWQGYSGLTLTQVIDKLKHLSRFGPQPSTSLLHCGGNDLGHISIRKLRLQTRQIMKFISLYFPQTKIILSCILPRTFWRHSQNNDKMEAARRCFNSFASAIVKSRGGAVISYPDIKRQPAILSSDGVHLSKLGNSILLNTLQGGLEGIILHNMTHFPS